MARTAIYNTEMVESAQQMVKNAKTAREIRTGLSILIPKSCAISNVETAGILCIGVATVVRMQKEIRDQVAGMATEKKSWGGRRRQNFSLQEEKEFLKPWVEQAEKGGVLVVPPVHEALEKKLGRKVAESTVYRLLARHDWRKIAPDTCHPKKDPDAQEVFKKNSRKRWIRLPNKMD
jgi:transposase